MQRKAPLNFFQLGLCGTLMFLLGACGSDNAANSLQKLSSHQKTKLNQVVDSVGTVQKSMPETSLRSEPSSRLLVSSLHSPSQPHPSNPALYERFQRSILEGDCEIQSSMPEPGSDLGGIGEIELQFLLNGTHCPVHYHLGFEAKLPTHASMSGMDIGFNIDTAYQVISPELKELHDVYGYHFHARTNVQAQSTAMTMTLTGNGRIESHSEGLVKLALKGTFTGTQDKAVGGMAFSFEFPDFTAVIQAKLIGTDSIGNPKMVYSLNGETITEAEFMDYLKRLFPSVSENVSLTPPQEQYPDFPDSDRSHPDFEFPFHQE